MLTNFCYDYIIAKCCCLQKVIIKEQTIELNESHESSYVIRHFFVVKCQFFGSVSVLSL